MTSRTVTIKTCPCDTKALEIIIKVTHMERLLFIKLLDYATL